MSSGGIGIVDFSSINSDAIPATTDVFDLGSADKKWKSCRVSQDLEVGGNLIVEGATTTIESVTLTVDDKNIELGSVDVPTDLTADGGGITLKGTTDKTILWNDATNSWDFNQAIRTGNLQLNGNTLSSTDTNGNILLSPDGTGGVAIAGVTPVSGTRLLLPQEDDAVTPTLAFGDGDTGFYERVDDDLRVSIGGVNTFLFFQTQFRAANGLGPALQNRAATNVVPTLVPDISDDNTGIGQAAADQLSLIAGGVEQGRFDVTGNHVINSLLDAATGNEVALSLNYTTNKATSGSDTGLVVNQTDTLSPGTSLLMDLQQGGTSQFSVMAAGNVGIGTTSPGSLLDVRDSTNSGTTLVIGGDTVDQNRTVRFLETHIAEVNGFRGGFIQYNGLSNRLLIGVHNLQTTDTADDNSAIAIKRDTGSVGIGINFTSPSTNFHIFENNTDTIPSMEIEQNGTGDAALQFSISGDSYAVGIDNSDLDKFKISYAAGAGTAVLGTNDRFVIDATGDITATGVFTASNLKSITLIEDRSPAAATTTSGTYATLISSASTTFSGRPVLVILHTSLLSTDINTVVEFAIQIDSGSDVEIGKEAFNVASAHSAVTGALIVTPTAGSHTINLRWRRGVGTGTLTYDSNDQILVHAAEL